MNKELIDAIRTGTVEQIALQLALLPCFQGGFDAEHITATAIVAAREPVDSQVRFVSVRDDGDIRPMTLAKSRDACEMLCSLGGVPVESIQQVRITKERKDV